MNTNEKYNEWMKDLGSKIDKNEEVCYYTRYAPKNTDAQQKDGMLTDFQTAWDLKSVFFRVDENCLGSTPPLSRECFCEIMKDIVAKKVKTLVVAHLCDISTDPQEIVVRLYDLTKRGVTVIALNGFVIQEEDVEAFTYLPVLNEIEGWVEENAGNRFELVAQHPSRKVWYDTVEDVLYCKLWSEDGTTYFLPLEVSLSYKKAEWDARDETDDSLDQVYQVIYESSFVEEIRHEGVDYYVWFELNSRALRPHCFVHLDNYWINETNKAIK